MIGQCHECPLDSISVAGDGSLSARVVVIGEAPGRDELRAGIPFIGQAGQELDKLLPLAGLARADIYVDNVVACRPPAQRGNKPPPLQAVKACVGRLEGVMQGIDPEVVVLVGKTPIAVFGGGLALKAHHGLVYERELWGKVRKMVIMYHPAAGLHQPALRAVMAEDWRRLPERLAEVGRSAFTPRRKQDFWPGVGKPTMWAIDTETAWLGALDAPLVGVSIAVEDVVHWCTGEMLEPILVMSPTVFHNAKYDYQVLRRHGSYIKPETMRDTMIAAYLVGEPSLGLKGLAKRYLNYEMQTLQPLLDKAQAILLDEYLEKANKLMFEDYLSKTMKKSLEAVMSSEDKAKALSRRYKLREALGQPRAANVADVAHLLPQELMDYACDDADVTLALWPIFEKKMQDMGVEDLFYKVEMPLVPVLADMERRGLSIDRQEASKLNTKWHREMEAIQKGLKRRLGLDNPASPKQVADVLFRVLGYEPLARTDTGQSSTAAWVLERLSEEDPDVQRILDWRHLAKLCSTYLEPWLRTDGRIHPDFNQVRQRGEDAEGATVTGRLSSSGPNFQNVPKRTEDGRAVRSCVVADEGHILLSFDYEQLEWVLLGVAAGDETILQAYRDGSFNIHDHNKELIGVDYDTGKRVTYLWVYGGGDGKLSQVLGCSRAVAAEYLRRLESGYPRVVEWREAEVSKARELGYASTLWGRRRYIPELATAQNDYEYREASKRAFNMFPTGTAADIAKLACSRVDSWLAHEGLNTLTTGMIAMVHDEILIEVPTSALTKRLVCAIIEVMQGAGEGLPLTLGVDLKAGGRWGSLEPVRLEELP